MVAGGERARCEALASQHEAAGRLEEALTALTRQWLTTLDRTQRRALRPRLQQLSEKVHTGPTPPATMTLYTVSKGDSLWKIAQKNQTEHASLQRFNRISDRTLRVGQRLRVPCAPVTVVAFKRDFEVMVLLGPNALRVYDVATGKDGKTPEATFKIGTKMVNPDWYSPEGKLYKFGTPENVLGTRWLAFENTDQHQGFGIHGTRFPESIGTEASMGCLRMRNEEVEELYDFVPKGSTVRIVK
jgi:lipoprotein-anchoring transpeptidase ErfK/SrfK